MFEKVMTIPDSLIIKYYELVTDINPDEIGKIRISLNENSLNPRDIKMKLAKEIVKLYHKDKEAEIAEKILEDKSFNSEKIETIKKCIITHSKPIQIGDGPLEAVCVSNADAISQIIRPVYWMYYIFSVRKMNFEQGREWYSLRIKENWDSLVQPAKDMIREEYDHMKALFL
jgi:hypothetical protein